MFVDDLILFIKVTCLSFQIINNIFNQFKRVSRLVINWVKFELWFSPNTPREWRKDFTNQLGVKLVHKFEF